MDFQKHDNESVRDYKIRLFQNKDIYGLTSQQIADLVNKESGENFSESTYRKWYKAYSEGLTDGKKQAIGSNEILKEYEQKRIELEKEKMRFFDQRTAYTKEIRKDARWDELHDIIERTIQSGNLPEIKGGYTCQHSYENAISIFDTFTKKPNDLLVSLNDLHYGANINNAWNVYNSDICQERLNTYLQEILEIQKTHGSENCYVTANGDLINGNIHLSVQVANKENVIEQIMGVSECIAQFLGELSKHFNKVVFVVVAGNHSRLGTKEDSLKGERLDDLIPWYVKARLQNVDNVFVNKNLDNTMSLVDIRGKNYVCVHGDYDRGKSAIQSLALMGGKDIYAVCCGHLHHNSLDMVNNIKVIMAGSFLGMDDYCISKRIVGIPQQLVCVCDENGVKCSYDINF